MLGDVDPTPISFSPRYAGRLLPLTSMCNPNFRLNFLAPARELAWPRSGSVLFASCPIPCLATHSLAYAWRWEPNAATSFHAGTIAGSFAGTAAPVLVLILWHSFPCAFLRLNCGRFGIRFQSIRVGPACTPPPACSLFICPPAVPPASIPWLRCATSK